MSATLLSKVISLGNSNDLPAYLQRKVQTTNIITLILLFAIALPFVAISLVYFPFLAIFPAAGALICAMVLIANAMGAIYYSRVVIAVLPILLGAAYNAYLCGPDDGPIPSVYLVELSFALIPFIIFDLKEKGFLIFSEIICIATIVSFPVTKLWVDYDGDVSVLREGWLSTLTIVLAIITELACVYGLATLNKQSEDKAEKLISEMDAKNAVLEDSAAAMKENLRKLEEAQLAEQKRSWATEGIARISETIRTSQNSAEMYDKIISQLVQYAKANQGGLYIVHHKGEVNPETSIKLASCYAYSRKKYIEQSYAPGEGLLGQAYLEKEYIFMTDIPEGYVRITSGLGAANPRSLLIMPMKVNGVVEGLLEIASFHKFEAHEIDFFERLGETIASSIQHQRINEQTRYLLENTLSQSEAMRAQEEELRQNLEELASTQEEMQRKEVEYINRIQELENRTAAGKHRSFLLER
jgi:GAF domain-containing protein/cell division protein FtsB